MKNQDFYDLGNQIQDIVQKAVDSSNYQELNQSIRKALNTAVDSGSQALKDALDGYSRPKGAGQNVYRTERKEDASRSTARTSARVQRSTVEVVPETKPALYRKTGGEQAKGVLMTVGGSVLGGSMGVSLLVTTIVKSAMGIGSVWSVGTSIMAAGLVVGAGLLISGINRLGRLGRFKKYVKALGNRTYSDFTGLARLVGKPVKFVKRDIKGMIDRGWFLEGHLDKEETCLITSDEMYRQYQETERQQEQRKQEEQEAADAAGNTDPKVQEVLNKGNEYLRQIRKCNEDIPGEEISGKISRIEMLVNRIFERAAQHPEIIPDLKKMMDYYLPMTVKLLRAYADMDSQPVQGENITSSKQEIEKTLDTLNVAFEKILDSIFQDTAWDVSSDISVLHTMLAQEGLTENDFS